MITRCGKTRRLFNCRLVHPLILGEKVGKKVFEQQKGICAAHGQKKLHLCQREEVEKINGVERHQVFPLLCRQERQKSRGEWTQVRRRSRS